MSSKNYRFQVILAISNGKQPPTSITTTELADIKVHLSQPIIGFRITSLTMGPDPQGVQNRAQTDSKNHSVLYLQTDLGQIRFDMQNQMSSQKGKQAAGVLIVKFQTFTEPSTKTATHLDCPWYSHGRMETGSVFVKALDWMGAENYKMTVELEGCRSWVREVCEPLMVAGLTNLDFADNNMNWTPIGTGGFATD